MDTDINAGFDMGASLRRIEKGSCRIAWNGQVAVRTTSGYKTYSPESGALVNCSSFVSGFADDFFYLVPAMKVKRGDIVLIGGLPRCVMESGKNRLTVMTYETGTVETLIPERFMFMGNVCFFSKVVCPMAGMFSSGKGRMNRMIRMMMLSDMMNGGQRNPSQRIPGNDAQPGGGMGVSLMQLMMMQGMMKDMGETFGDMFADFDEDDNEDGDNEDSDNEDGDNEDND